MGVLDEVVYVGRPAWIGGSNGRHRRGTNCEEHYWVLDLRRMKVELMPGVNSIIFPDDEYRMSECYGHDFMYSEIPELSGIGDCQKAFLVWKVYADDMPPQSKSIAIADIPIKPT